MILNEVYVTRLSLVESKGPVNEITQSDPNVLATVRGTFATYNKKNKNDRMYKDAVWQKALNDPEVRANLKGKRMFGELDHPEEYLEIKLPNTAFCVTDLQMDEATETIQGELKVLNTPAGNILNTLIRFGSELGISSRASGELDPSGNVIAESFDLITFDIVTNPSNEDAHPKMVAEATQAPKFSAALMESVKTADKQQLEIIKTMATQLNEDEAAEVNSQIADKEKELDSEQPAQEPDKLDLILSRLDSIDGRLSAIEAMLNKQSQGEPETPEADGENQDEPGLVTSKVEEKREPVRVKAKSKIVESVETQQAIVSVERVKMETEDDGVERCAHLIKINKSK